MKLAEKQKSESKNAQIQNWVNNIAEETSDTSPPPDDESADVIPPVSAKSNINGQKVGPPKTKTKYTTHGRRTSSMSGIDIQKTSKMNLSTLPQPADLSLPVGYSNNLKKSSPKKTAPLVDTPNASKLKDWKASEHEEKDWTIIDLQNGIGSEGSSFEHIEKLDDIELELGFEQVEIWSKV